MGPSASPEGTCGHAVTKRAYESTSAAASRSVFRNQRLRHLREPAHAIDQLHRPKARAVGVEQAGAVNEDGDALCARDRDVQAVGVEQEVEAAGDVLAG